jgi:penicillin V acylase-like amidase (Ntn superfamily)
VATLPDEGKPGLIAQNELIMKIFRLVLILLLLFPGGMTAEACTAAVVSGKATPDGRPMIWKHRDSDHPQNAIRYFNDGKYASIGVINSADKAGEEIWAGYNSAGFAIINTASYNLPAEGDTVKLKDREGIVMRQALQECATVEEFERFLKKAPKPLGVEANFGVIDARGGAA